MTVPPKPGRRSTASIFAWPLAIAVASVAGLVSALVGDGVYDILSWLLLGGAVALIVQRVR